MQKVSGSKVLTKAKSFAGKHKGLCWVAGGLAAAANPAGALLIAAGIGTALYIKQVRDDKGTPSQFQADANWASERSNTEADYTTRKTYAAETSRADNTGSSRTVCHEGQQTAAHNNAAAPTTSVKAAKQQKAALNKERLAEQVNAHISYLWDWVAFSDGYATVVDDEGTEYVVYFDPATSTVLSVEKSEPVEEADSPETSSSEKASDNSSAAEEIARQWIEDNENAIYCLFLDSDGDDVLLDASMLPEERQAWPYICKSLENYCDDQKKVIKSGDQIIVCG